MSVIAIDFDSKTATIEGVDLDAVPVCEWKPPDCDNPATWQLIFLCHCMSLLCDGHAASWRDSLTFDHQVALRGCVGCRIIWGIGTLADFVRVEPL